MLGKTQVAPRGLPRPPPQVLSIVLSNIQVLSWS